MWLKERFYYPLSTRLDLEVLKYVYITLFIYIYILNRFLSMLRVTLVGSLFANVVIGKGIITAAEGFKGTWKFLIQSPVVNFDIENCVESKNIFNGVMYLSENENESENVFNILVKK